MGEDITIIAPTTGRLLLFKLSKEDCVAINRRREDANNNAKKLTNGLGYVAHTGNPVSAGDVVPMIVVTAWENGLVNGQALLDGNDNYWVTSAKRGEGEHEWNWMPYQLGMNAKKYKEHNLEERIITQEDVDANPDAGLILGEYVLSLIVPAGEEKAKEDDGCENEGEENGEEDRKDDGEKEEKPADDQRSIEG